MNFYNLRHFASKPFASRARSADNPSNTANDSVITAAANAHGGDQCLRHRRVWQCSPWRARTFGSADNAREPDKASHAPAPFSASIPAKAGNASSGLHGHHCRQDWHVSIADYADNAKSGDHGVSVGIGSQPTRLPRFAINRGIPYG